MDTLQSSDNYFSTLLSGNEGVRYQCINVTDIKKKIGVVQLVAFWYIKCTIQKHYGTHSGPQLVF